MEVAVPPPPPLPPPPPAVKLLSERHLRLYRAVWLRLRLDVISQDGKFRFNLGDGRFASQLLVPGRADVVRAGTAVIVGDRLLLTDDGSVASRSIPFTFVAGVLRLTDPTFAFDFNNVGRALPAVLTAELVRR